MEISGGSGPASDLLGWPSPSWSAGSFAAVVALVSAQHQPRAVPPLTSRKITHLSHDATMSTHNWTEPRQPEQDTARRLSALPTVALLDTAGALLSNLGTGYYEPRSHYNQIPGCPDEHLLWHIELDQLPSDQEQSRAVALKVASRIVSAFGVPQPLHLDREGALAGQLNVHRAKQ